MNWDPKKDGFDHINVYSRGQTLLGRRLSNFAHTPFEVPFYGKFASVEGYWFWILTKDERLRTVWGKEALDLGRKLKTERGIPDFSAPTVVQLRAAYRAKLHAHPGLQATLNSCALPLAHYYVYQGRVVVPMQWQWTVGLWEEFRAPQPILTPPNP